MNWDISQRDMADRFDVEAIVVQPAGIVGISDGVRLGEWPLNGLRHPPERGESGWYIWSGEELSAAADFFKPLHAEHLAGFRSQAIPYLGLPPGWRFLIAPGYEDVWFDEGLLVPSE